jgi:hypothetical protein
LFSLGAAEKVSSPVFDSFIDVLFGIPRDAKALVEALAQNELNPDYGFCDFFSKNLQNLYRD